MWAHSKTLSAIGGSPPSSKSFTGHSAIVRNAFAAPTMSSSYTLPAASSTSCLMVVVVVRRRSVHPGCRWTTGASKWFSQLVTGRPVFGAASFSSSMSKLLSPIHHTGQAATTCIFIRQSRSADVDLLSLNGQAGRRWPTVMGKSKSRSCEAKLPKSSSCADDLLGDGSSAGWALTTGTKAGRVMTTCMTHWKCRSSIDDLYENRLGGGSLKRALRFDPWPTL